MSLFSEKKPEAKIETDIPSQFLCGLSGKIMKKPVRIFQSPNKTAYDFEELTAYFEENGHEDPETGNAIAKDDVIEDVELKGRIQTFIRNNPQLWPKIPIPQARN